MKCLMYCTAVFCFLLGLFIGFVYLMTLVDPGLLQLREKATAMIREDRREPELPVTKASTLLPSEDYMDAATLLREIMPNLVRP